MKGAPAANRKGQAIFQNGENGEYCGLKHQLRKRAAADLARHPPFSSALIEPTDPDLQPEADASYSYRISRIVDRRFVLDAHQKETFVRLMRGYENYCGDQITFCVRSNHFHILLRVPRRPTSDLLPSDAELVERLRKETGTGNFSGSSGFLDKIQLASTLPT